MVSGGWRSLNDEIARWRDAGRPVEFWWRDDDAARPTPALDRLFTLSAQTGVPLALAVVPGLAQRALFEGLGGNVAVLQHGVDHRNRAAQGGKKTEFPPGESAQAALARLAEGRAKLVSLAGERVVAALAPPWNRFPAALVAQLPAAGLRGLSTYGARLAQRPAPGVTQVNTHVDVIAWKAGRGFVGEEEALGQAVRHLAARRDATVDPAEPTGWLTHHACHDEAAWKFLARLFETTRGAPDVFWRRAEELF